MLVVVIEVQVVLQLWQSCNSTEILAMVFAISILLFFSIPTQIQLLSYEIISQSSVSLVKMILYNVLTFLFFLVISNSSFGILL